MPLRPKCRPLEPPARRRPARPAWLAAGFAACLGLLAAGASRAATTQWVSRPAGVQQSTTSQHGAVSADGRYVAFLSDAANLMPGQNDVNGTADVFLYDRQAGSSVLVSRTAASLSSTGNGPSVSPALSADGRYVAFASDATNLVAGQMDGNLGGDIFLYDRVTGTTTLVSHAAGSATSTGDNVSDAPAISADGRYVAFASTASNLVAGVTDFGGNRDIFLYDRVTGSTILVSRSAANPAMRANDNSFAPGVSDDGRFTVYTSYSTNLVAGQSDVVGSFDIFLFDRQAGTTALVSHASGSAATASSGVSTLPDVSADGAYVTFRSTGTNLVPGQVSGGEYNVFLYERSTGGLRLVSGHGGSTTQAAGASLSSLSADGRFVVFQSGAADLVPGQLDQNDGQFVKDDTFLFDRATGAITLVSHAFGSFTATGELGSYDPAISADGRYVAYRSAAEDLVPGVTGLLGITNYLFDRLTGATRLLARTAGGDAAFDSHGIPAMNADGSAVAFTTRGSLAFDDEDNEDVYLWTNFPVDRSFYTLTPCRLYDSRLSSGGALVSGSPRLVFAAGSCNVSLAAAAVAANVTVLQPSGTGHLILHTADSSAPRASTINFNAGQVRANNAILELAANGDLTVTPVVSGSGTVHVLIDVSGYFE